MICSSKIGCGRDLEKSQFKTIGRTNLCIDCFKKAKSIEGKKYRLKHKDKLKKYAKEYYLKNKELIDERNLKYYQDNKEKALLYQKNYRDQIKLVASSH